MFLSKLKERLVSKTKKALCKSIRPWLICCTGPGEWVYLISYVRRWLGNICNPKKTVLCEIVDKGGHV